MRHRSVGLLVLALLLCCAASAPAQTFPDTPTFAVPASAPVVAGPTANGSALLAFLHGTRLCTTVAEAGAPRPTTVPTDACTAIPTLAPFGHHGGGATSVHGRWLTSGVAGSDTAAVEERDGSTVVAHDDLTVSPLPGAAAELRFYLLESGAREPFDELALLDATGTVRRAANGLLDGLVESASERPRSRPVLQRGRAGTATWTLHAWAERRLHGTPLQPERRTTETCVSFATSTAPDAEDSGTCDQDAAVSAPVVPILGSACAPVGGYVGVLARPEVGRVVAVLGDGSRKALPLRPVHGGTAGLRAGVVVAGAGVALRRLVVLGHAGQTLTAFELRMAPVPARGGQTCGNAVWFLTFSTADLPRIGAGPHSPAAVDAGASLCLAFDRAPRVPADCGPVPTDVEETYLSRRRTADGRLVYGLVGTDVARARLTLDDGTTRTVAATPIPGYAGQYADTVRLVAADVRGGHRVIGYALEDARGRALLHLDGLPERPALVDAALLLRTPGLPPLRTALAPDARPHAKAEVCLALGALERDYGCDTTTAGSFAAVARCAPDRIAVFGLLAHATDRLSVLTASGREIRARTAALPAAIARVAGGSRAALVVLGPGDAPRRLLLRGRSGTKRAALVLPAAGEQCGYDVRFMDRPA